MHMIRVLPFVLLITFACAVIRPQSYLDSLAGTATTVRYQANVNTLVTNTTTDVANIRMGGNRDIGVQVVLGTTSGQISMRCDGGGFRECRGDTPTGIRADYYYQLDGPSDTAIGTAASPSLGSTGIFDFSEAGESGLVVNVTRDHTITITFSVYSGAAPSNANRFSYVLTIPHNVDDTLTSSYFIPYASWTQTGSANFRAATAFAYIVVGDTELDWIINLFAPYANTISGRVFIDCNDNCIVDSTELSTTFSSSIQITAVDINDPSQSFAVTIQPNANPIYTIGVFVTASPPSPNTRIYRVCSAAPQGFITTEVDGCEDPLAGINFAANNQGNCVDVSVDFLEEVVGVNFAVYRFPVITAPAGSTAECTSTSIPNLSASGTPTTNIPSVCQSTVTSSDVTASLCADSGSVSLTRTWFVTDLASRSATSNQVIQVTDTTRPTIIPAPNTSVDCTARNNVALTSAPTTGTVSVSDACSSIVTVSISDSTAPTACFASIVRTWNARDSCGNLATSTQFITVFDNSPPTWASIPSPTTLECDRFNPNLTSVASLGSPSGSSDNCAIASSLTQGGPTTISSGTVCGAGQIFTRNWTLQDTCGNVATATQLFTVRDTLSPSFTIVSPTSFDCSVGALPNPPVNDQCDSGATIDAGFIIVGTATCSDTRTRRYTAVDSCGNTRTADQIVTVADNSPPSPSGQVNVNVACTATSTAAVGYPLPTATDNCSPPTRTLASESNTFPASAPGCARYTFTRTWLFNDGCLTATFVQTVSVSDLQPPSIFPPSTSFFDCTLIDSPTINFPNLTSGTATATDACSTIASITAGSWVPLVTPGPCFNSIQRVWRADDACGNFATATQNAEFSDSQAPVLTNAANLQSTFVVECPGSTISTSPIFSDSCSRTVVNGPEERFSGGTPNCNQVITRTWSATDCSNLVTFFTQTVTIRDTTRPSITPPANTSAACDADGSINLGTPAVSDSCSLGTNIPTFTPATSTSGSCGTEQTYIWSITDACGNTATATQLVTVSDNEPPSVTPFTGNIVSCTATTNTAAAGIPTATDNCVSPSQIQRTLPIPQGPTTQGACVSDYTFVRTWNFSDGCNVTTFQQIVVVEDNIPPTLTIGSGPNVECVGGINFSTAVVTAGHSTASASDPNCTNLAITPTFRDVFTTFSICNAAIVRTWTASDVCGNSATASTTFNIVDTQNPTVSSVPSPTSLTCAPQPGATAPGLTIVGTAAASDACDPNPTLLFDDDIDTTDRCRYRITRNWRAQDFCGRTSVSVPQFFTLVDVDSPVITVPTRTEYPCTNTADTPLLSDPCGIVRGYGATLVSTSVLTTPCAQGGQDRFARTWVAQDVCGNTASSTQNFTGTDTVGPSFNAPQLFQTSDCSSPSALNPNPTTRSGLPSGYQDNCHPDATPDFTFTDSASFGNVCLRTVVRTWYSPDTCGNVGTATQLIRAVDENAPVFRTFPPSGTVPCDSTVPTSPSTSPSLPIFGIPQAVDNCNVVTPVFEDTVFEGCPRILTRTWSVNDGCNPTTFSAQLITFVDQNRPQFTYFPENAIIPCDVNADTSTLPSLVPGGTAGVPTAIDACDPTPSLSWQDSVQGPTCPSRSISRTWIARDNCANIETRVQILTLQVVDPPTLFVPADANLNCLESTLPSNRNVGTATASQQCNVPVTSVTFSDARVVDGCQEIITRTWTAIDQCGLRSTAIQSIIRGDNASPDWSIFPADVMITCDESTSPENTGIAIATDDCTFPVCDVTWDDYIEDLYDQYNTLGTCASNKQITRTWTARDDCGNELINIQVITILVNVPSGPCAKQPCEVEKCTPCECNYRHCDCCTGPTACTAVACKERVACTAVPCNTVNCIPCAPVTDIYPLPFCDDSVPCIPVIIPVFVDDDGVFQPGDEGEPLDSEYWLLRADYWKDLAIQRGIDNAQGLSSTLAPVVAFVVLLVSLPFTFYAFFN